MTERKILIPNESHPITIEPSPSKVLVDAGSLHIAASTNALTLREASYQPVQYVPRDDVDMSLLVRSNHTTYCPYKGEANYYSIPELGERGQNCVWTYEQPFDAVVSIGSHLAFYPDRVEISLRS